MKRSALWIAVVTLVGPPAPPPLLAQQDHPVVIVGFTYVPGQSGVPFGVTTEPAVPLIIAPGDTVTAANLDAVDVIENHTITSDNCSGNQPCGPANPIPLFDSGFVSVSQFAPVLGVDSLPPGTYPFHCKTHPFMHGSLVVQ